MMGRGCKMMGERKNRRESEGEREFLVGNKTERTRERKRDGAKQSVG